MVKSSNFRDPRKVATHVTPSKPVKFKKTMVIEKTHYDVFSKSRGYLCTSPNETEAHKALQSMYYENEKLWKHAMSDGKKTKPFDCYVLARTGSHERLIELQFAVEEEDASETYEDITASAGCES
jgi:hypothetical protein